MNFEFLVKWIKFSVKKTKGLKKYWKNGKKYWKSQGNLSVRKSGNPGNAEELESPKCSWEFFKMKKIKPSCINMEVVTAR